MIIVMSHKAAEAQVQSVIDRIQELGLRPEVSRGEDRAIIGVIGTNAYAYREAFSHLPGIHEILQISKPFKLASREWQPQDTVVDVGGVKIGGGEIVMMGRPPSVENEEELLGTARFLASPRARLPRRGALQPPAP